MSYVGNVPTTAAFPFDQFSGNGSTTAFTLSYAPAGSTSIIVSISGVVQNPNTYSVSGTTLTFTPAPPTGSNNIAVLYLGLPVVATLSPGNTAYFSSSVFTATAGQTVFTPSGTYQAGFINVIRNGSQLAPANYTATNGTTVTLANACTAGDIVVIEVFNLTSIAGALPVTGGTVTGATTFNSTVQVNGANVSGFTGFKNRIINPGMVIDQRFNGAASTSHGYVVDRWFSNINEVSGLVASRQRSTIAPANFINSFLFSVTTGATPSATQASGIYQGIEGLNVSDLGWGTANASPVTLSFWVRSSITGTHSGSFLNNAGNRAYPFTFTISVANTWEQKTVTIAGDTTGTWLTDVGVGVYVVFNTGSGSSRLATAGSWSTPSTNFPYGATGSVQLCQTTGATFYITGVQLERGSNATSYEFRSYGQELALCQRYFTLIASGTPFSIGSGCYYNALTAFGNFGLPVRMRTTPTIVITTGTSYYVIYRNNAGNVCNSLTLDQSSPQMVEFYNATEVSGTIGHAGFWRTNNALAYFAVQAEL